jgi:predicted transcriptional regulator of viral defense system
MAVVDRAVGARRAGLHPQLAAAPLRTVRARDVTAYAQPRQQLARLTRRGLLHRLADGYYTVVPQDRVGADWMPTLEAAAAAIAAAEFGASGFALMGLTAARIHHAVPRAIAFAVVAAPRRHETIRLTDRAATIQFLSRGVDRLDVELLATDLGPCLVTTPEQTVLDLAHLPRLGGLEDEADAAIRLLLPRCDEAMMQRLAEEQPLGRALARVRRLRRAA